MRLFLGLLGLMVSATLNNEFGRLFACQVRDFRETNGPTATETTAPLIFSFRPKMTVRWHRKLVSPGFYEYCSKFDFRRADLQLRPCLFEGDNGRIHAERKNLD